CTDLCYDLSGYATRDVAAARIPIEQAQGPILLLSADDDHMWPSAPMADHIVQRMRDHGRGEHVTSVVYSGAGHAFLTRDFLQAQGETVPFDFGGDTEADRAAADDAWKRILSFLEASHTRT